MRERFRDEETVSMWQSLAFGPNYKSAYCMAVCPAGEDLLPLFTEDRKHYIEDVVVPLRNRREPVYVKAGTPAEKAARKNARKAIRHLKTFPKPTTFQGFLRGAPLAFNPLKAGSLSAVYHFRMHGGVPAEATLAVAGGKLKVHPGLVGTADLTLDTDAKTWLAIARGERPVLPALLTRRLRLLAALKKCLE